MFIAREEPFICEHCGEQVQPLLKGTYRDHCPKCLTSKHVDRDGPGDRLSECLGLLKPIAIDSDSKKGFVIVYECEKCHKTHRNKASEDDDLIGFLKTIDSRL